MLLLDLGLQLLVPLLPDHLGGCLIEEILGGQVVSAVPSDLLIRLRFAPAQGLGASVAQVLSVP